MKMNKQQLDAVQEMKCDLLVTAGAGTGKTRVLTEKYLLLVEQEGMDPREIVAITFTQKAAFEMRTRVRQTMATRAAADGAQSGYWQSRQEALESAYIGTFHGFCQGLIREFPLISGIAPNLRILSAGEEQILLTAAAERAVARNAREGSLEEREAYWQVVMEHGMQFFLRHLRELLPKLRESGKTSDDWVKLAAGNVELGNDPTSRLKTAVMDLLNFEGSAKLSERAQTLFAEAKAGLAQLFPAPDGELSESARRLERLKQLFPKNLGKNVRDLVEEVHIEIEKGLEYLADREFSRCLPTVGRFLSILAEEYDRAKELQGALDFADLQIRARNLLRDSPEVRSFCQEHYAYFMVDEFQDTNRLQLEIVQLLAGTGQGRGRLFVVGDPKQSIYRFRGAQVEVVQTLGDELMSGNGRILPLQENYRCHPAVIDGINAIFEPLFQNDPITYQPLIAGLSGGSAEAELPRLQVLTVSEDNRAIEAEQLAMYLRNAFAGEVCLVNADGEKRPIRPGDVVILLRAMTHVADYEAALRRWKIPYVLSGGAGYYGLQEVQDQLNLIRLVRNSEDSLSLLALLRSPYAGLSDEELYWLAQAKGGLLEGFYHLKTRPEGVEEAAWERMLALRRVVKELLEGRSFLTVSEMLQYALDELKYDETLCALPYAERSLANLEKLLHKADEFALIGGHYGLGDFLDFIGDLISVEEREGEAKLETAEADAVQIMTVHAAKGLEFPLVVLADMERGFNKRDNSSILYHNDCGFVFKVPHGQGGSVEPSLWKRIREQNRLEEISELKRLFYVALTRAKEYLVFSGVNENAEAGEDDGSWADWLRRRLPENWQEQDCVILGQRPAAIYRGGAGEDLNISPDLLDSGAQIAAATEISAAPLPPPGLSNERRLRFSVTPLLDYVDCPRYYYWRYRLGVESQQATGDEGFAAGDSGHGALIGQIVHGLCAMNMPDQTVVEQYIRKNLSQLPEQDRAALQIVVWRMWEKYRQSSYAKTMGKVCSEYPFTVPLGENAYLHGIIDRLIFDGNDPQKVRLVDFKTNRIDRSKLARTAAGYRPQLLSYSLAVQKMFGVLPERVELFFLNIGEVWQEPITGDDVAKWEVCLTHAVKQLAGALGPQDFAPTRHCATCLNNRWCAAKIEEKPSGLD